MKWLQEAAGAEKFVPAKAEPALQDIKPKQPISAAPQLCLPDPDLPTVQFKQELFVKEEQGLPSTSAGVRGRRKSLFTSLASTSQQQPEAGVMPVIRIRSLNRVHFVVVHMLTTPSCSEPRGPLFRHKLCMQVSSQSIRH